MGTCIWYLQWMVEYFRSAVFLARKSCRPIIPEIATKEPCTLEALVPSDGNLAFSSDEKAFLRDAFPMAELDWQSSYRLPSLLDIDYLILLRRGAVYLIGCNWSLPA